jgi:transketolase
MLRKTAFTPQEESKATREGFGEGLLEAGTHNDRIVALCADLTESVKMDAFRAQFPKRFFEMGITEQAMSGVASGMASMGYVPFIASYAMFSPGRNWEQIQQNPNRSQGFGLEFDWPEDLERECVESWSNET